MAYFLHTQQTTYFGHKTSAEGNFEPYYYKCCYKYNGILKVVYKNEWTVPTNLVEFTKNNTLHRKAKKTCRYSS